MDHTYGSQPRLGTASNEQDAQTNSTAAAIPPTSQSFAVLRKTAGGAAAPARCTQRAVIRVVGRPAATSAAVAATAASAAAATVDDRTAASGTVADTSAAACTATVAAAVVSVAVTSVAAATADDAAVAATENEETAVPSAGGLDDALAVDAIAAAIDAAVVSDVWEDMLSSDDNLAEDTQAAGVSLSQVWLFKSILVALSDYRTS